MRKARCFATGLTDRRPELEASEGGLLYLSIIQFKSGGQLISESAHCVPEAATHGCG